MTEVTVNAQCTSLLDIATKQCHSCRNSAGIFTCHGCCRHFCPEHVVEHRKTLAPSLNALILANQQLGTTTNTGNHQRETDQRKQLIMCRDRFTTRLQEARARDNYHERHLKYWQQFLEDLKENFVRLQTGRAPSDSYGSLAKRLASSDPPATVRFSKWCEYKENCLQVADLRRTEEYRDGNDTQPILTGPCTNAPVRSQSSSPMRVPHPRTPSPGTLSAQRYSSKSSSDETEPDEYRFTLAAGDTFIGIISTVGKIIDVPLNTPSVYGWSITDDGIYRNGRRQARANNDLRPGDVVVLMLYAEDRMIRLTNLTRARVHELPIDLAKCPLPWTLKMILHNVNQF